MIKNDNTYRNDRLRNAMMNGFSLKNNVFPLDCFAASVFNVFAVHGCNRICQYSVSYHKNVAECFKENFLWVVNSGLQVTLKSRILVTHFSC